MAGTAAARQVDPYVLKGLWSSILLPDDYLDRGDVSLLWAFANDLGVDADVLDLELTVAQPLCDDLCHVHRSADGHPPRLHRHLAGLSQLDERAHGVVHHRLLAHEDVVVGSCPLCRCVLCWRCGLFCGLLSLWFVCVGFLSWHFCDLVWNGRPGAYITAPAAISCSQRYSDRSTWLSAFPVSKYRLTFRAAATLTLARSSPRGSPELCRLPAKFGRSQAGVENCSLPSFFQ